jgi:hypothetical protein
VTILRTEVADRSGGAVVVETRVMWSGAWETVVAPGSDPDPDGPDACLFATCVRAQEAMVAHDQAIEFATNALTSTLRRARS